MLGIHNNDVPHDAHIQEQARVVSRGASLPPPWGAYRGRFFGEIAWARASGMGDAGADFAHRPPDGVQDKHKAPAPLYTAPCPYRKNGTFPKNLPVRAGGV
jgi:hypothetical protein